MTHISRIITWLILTIAASPGSAQECLDVPHAVFAQHLASAHERRELAALDRKYSGLAPFQIYIEHSIGEGADGTPIFVTAVQSFAELAELLESRQADETFPEPKSRALRRCANGVCSYDFFTGISHNSLYLKEIRYNDYVECLELETIWFLDGD